MINNNKVVISGIDTSKLPVLSDEQKEKLLIRIKQGDKAGAVRVVFNGLYGRGDVVFVALEVDDAVLAEGERVWTICFRSAV